MPTPRRVPSPAKALNRALGAHLKALRKKAGLRQQDVAAAAQRHGLSWTATTVGAVESGWREIRTSELFVLPRVLAEAGLAATLTLEDIVPPALISAWMRDRYNLARHQALSRWGSREHRLWLSEVGHPPDIPKVIGEDADGKPIFDEKTPRRPPLPEQIEAAASQETELTAAAKLTLHPHQVALRAWRLWRDKQWQHPTLSLERDARMKAAEQQDARLQDPTVPEQKKTKRRQALRGHWTRQLIEQLRAQGRKRGSR